METGVPTVPTTNREEPNQHENFRREYGVYGGATELAIYRYPVTYPDDITMDPDKLELIRQAIINDMHLRN